ncbi:hypothetical protein ABI59_17420 [Acidobacteria bacterium Mor1]|nr:hypothetical protein ABI59_17420 [Acidobacteria bacterium Mor1]
MIMPFGRVWKVSFVAVLLLVGSGVAAVADVAPREEAARDYLDYGFQFASALSVDPKDMTRAQESVVRELIEVGELERAAGMAERIEGWRRGVALADLAAEYAKQGDLTRARRLVDAADRFQRGMTGWYGPRIRAHIAEALAMIGEQDRATRISGDLASSDRSQYLGRSAAAAAVAMAVNGDFEGALGRLDSQESKTYEDAWYRTGGYIEISRQKPLSRQQRVEALDAAWQSALVVPGWRAIEAFSVIGDEYARIGEKDKAREALADVEEKLGRMAADHVAKAPLLAKTGISFARIGDRDHARELIERAEAVARGERISVIERPKFMAMAAMAYLINEDDEQATRLFNEALDQAASLVNARPRALAVVEICRAMSRHGYPVNDITRHKLDTLYTGLKSPW